MFLIGAMASGYVMYGFDTASSLGEETKDPKRTAPKAILRAVTASFLLGGLILLGGLLAAPDLSDPKVGSADGGLQYVVLSVLGGPFGKAFLACIVVAVVVCTLAVHAAAIRMMFAMARDNNLPFSRQLSKVDPVRRTPSGGSHRHRCHRGHPADCQRDAAGHFHHPVQHQHRPDLPVLPAGHRAHAAEPAPEEVAAQGG